MRLAPLLALVLLVALSRPVAAQQRPLATEDPEAIGAGLLLIEGGIDYANNLRYPASGLTGDLWRIPTFGVSVGISSIAEFQMDAGLHNRLAIEERRPAPLAPLLNVTGDTTSDVEDLVVGTKIRLLSERANRPAFALRVATKVPNATNESGLGLDTIDFYATLLGGKTIQSIRLVGNLGVGILADPTVGHRQNDVVTYGVSLARGLTDRTELVSELNGRVSTRSGSAYPGTETRGTLTVGGRYTTGAFRLDGSLFLGLNSVGPTAGFGAGFTYVFRAFQIP